MAKQSATQFIGEVTLSADPTGALAAATKQYTDKKLALTGGTLTGKLTQTGGGLAINGLANPAAPTVANVGTTGTTTYSYYVVAKDSAGNKTLASPVGSTTTGNAILDATNYNTVSWTAVAGAVSYDVLKGNTTTSLATAVTGTSVNDTGQATAAYTAPTRNATADVAAGQITLATNQQLRLSTNTPNGGISRSLRFDMGTAYDRPWISWVDENARHRVAAGYHTLDFASGNTHAAYEIKTSTAPAAASPSDMITRFSVGTDGELVNAGFNGLSDFTIRNATATVFKVDTATGINYVGDGTNTSVRSEFNGRAYVGYNGANAIIQGTASKGLVLAVNNNTFGSGIALHIDSSANIGIGKTPTTNKLDVNGTVAATHIKAAKRVNTLTVATATYTANADTTDTALITAPTAAFTVANPTGTITDEQQLTYRIKSGATGYAPTWGTAFSSSGVATLPTAALPANKTVRFGFIYNSDLVKWVLYAMDEVGV